MFGWFVCLAGLLSFPFVAYYYLMPLALLGVGYLLAGLILICFSKMHFFMYAVLLSIQFWQLQTQFELFDQPSQTEQVGFSLLSTPVATQFGYHALIQVFSDDFPQLNHKKVSLNFTQLLSTQCRYQGMIKFSRIRGRMNPGVLDEKKWLWQQQIWARGKLSSTVSACESEKRHLRLHIKQQLLTQDSLLPTTKAFVVALIFGDKSHFTREEKNHLLTSQVMHLFVVSGLHMSMLGLLLALVARLIYQLLPAQLLLTRQQLIIVFVLSGCFIYLYLADWQVAALRAYLALAVPLLCLLCNRRLALINYYLLTVFILIAIDASAILGHGFWLSLITVSGIYLLFATDQAQVLKGRSWAKTGGYSIYFYVQKLMKLQLFLLLFMLPVLSFLGYSSAFYAVLINLLLVPWVCLVLLPIAFLFLLFQLLSLEVGLSWLLNVQVAVIFDFLVYFQQWPRAHFALSLTQMSLLMLLYFLLLLRLYQPWNFLPVMLLVAVFSEQSAPMSDGEFQLELLDVGQGQALLIYTQHYLLVFDVGPGTDSINNSAQRIVAGRLEQLLYWHAPRMIELAISHDDHDHAFGFELLMQRFTIKQLWHAQPQRTKQNASDCRQGSQWQMDGVNFSWLSMAEFYPDNDNDASCVLSINSTFGKALITADLSKQGEYYLLQTQQLERVDLLVIGHHGSASATSFAFLNKTQPSYALISRGFDNAFSHPHPEVLNKLQQQGVSIFDTAYYGRVITGFTQQGIVWQNSENRLQEILNSARH